MTAAWVGGFAPPGEHGGDGEALAAALGIEATEVLDLSASLNPLAPDPVEVLGRHLAAVGRYPDATQASRALAGAIGVPEDRLVLTNGASEAIALVAAELGAGWVSEPEFSLYRRHLPRVDPEAPRWRSNPNNPTGELAAPQDRAEVWDESFWPLATGTWTRGDGEGGAFVIGSLTKLLACPGLRAGYVICPGTERADRISRRQPQWSLNGLAAAALAEMLAGVDLPTWSAGIAHLREQLVGVLAGHGLSARVASGNWVLVDAPGLREQLARQAVLVRDCASFAMPGTARIAVPNDSGLERLDRALASIEQRWR